MNWLQRKKINTVDLAGARGLGWASLGIALTELAAAESVERLIGVGDGQNTGILRAMGVRELMSGVDILSHADPTPGVWGRVAGDVLDVALLASAARKSRNPGGLAVAFAMVLGIGVLDVLFASRLSAEKSS